ncbi:hypothetical protein GCM10010272_54320 [Streptomyces lateritius]|nr:hypothetical protein GCM10010272_54320 [Streptomyces lateritius]
MVVEMFPLPNATTANAITAKIIVSRRAPGAHRVCPRTSVPSRRVYGRTQTIHTSPSKADFPAQPTMVTGAPDNRSAHHHSG